MSEAKPPAARKPPPCFRLGEWRMLICERNWPDEPDWPEEMAVRYALLYFGIAGKSWAVKRPDLNNRLEICGVAQHQPEDTVST